MSTNADTETVYSAIEEAARLAGAPCSRDNVWPVLNTFSGALPEAMIVFGMQAGERHAGELDYSFTVPPAIGDPYPHALENGLIAKTDHPVGSVLSDIQGQWPIKEYFVDAGVVGGFKKLYAHFPDVMQKVPEIAAIPSMPSAVAENAELFARHGLDQVAMVGVDYKNTAVSVYFHFGPDGRPSPATIRSLLADLGMPDPDESMLEFASKSLRVNITLGWDSPQVIRIAFAPPPVRGLDPSALPSRLAPRLEDFARNAPRVYTGGRVNMYAVKWMRGEEFLELNTYYQLSSLQKKLLTEAPKEQAAGASPQDLAAYANKLFEEALAGPREQLGERLFRMSLTAWENPRLRPQLLEKIGAATTSDAGAAQLRDHFSAMLVDRVGEVVPAPRIALNAVVAQVVGLIMLRYVMRMEPIASASVDELVATFAPTIQRYLDA